MEQLEIMHLILVLTCLIAGVSGQESKHIIFIWLPNRRSFVDCEENEFDPDEDLMDYGVDSMQIMALQRIIC